MAGKTLLSTSFSDGVDDFLSWMNPPDRVETVSKNAASPGGLLVYMDEKTDFWQKTYYTPTLEKDNGHLLHFAPLTSSVIVETSFKMNPVGMFDQAGLMIRYDTDHWIKTGLEFVDGACRLSCVVTNVNSDWSCQAWPSDELHIRVYRQGNDFVVEGSADGSSWDFLRICHLHVPKDSELLMGALVCAPTAAGGSTLFHKLILSENLGYHHTN